MIKSVTSIVLNNFTNDSRVLKENTSLHKAGYKVTVVALYENSLNEYDEINNVSVHRIKLKSRKWSKNKFIQLLKYIEFTYKVVNKYKNSDVIHCNDLDALVIGVIIKKIYNKNIKIVYDAHEYETETNALHGIQKKFVKWLEKNLIKDADAVITVSNSIANEYVKLYNIKKPSLVLNAPFYKEVKKTNLFREKFAIQDNQTIFLYQGNIGAGRGIDILLDTFKELDKKNVIIFMGYGKVDRIKELSEKYENIFFHEAVQPDILLNYTSAADFGISTIEASCLSYKYCLPNKMFEYIMAEVPVIVSDLPEMKNIVQNNHIGIIMKSNDKEGIKKAITEAITLDQNQLKHNLQNLKKIYNWEEQEKILLKVYKELFR